MLINADAGRIPLPDSFIHCALTSPPYFSQRRYPGAQERDWPAIEYAPWVNFAVDFVPAMRCALGLEPTPADFIGHLVAVCREVWRVLRDDGVFWLNLGDAFASGSPGTSQGMKPVTWSEDGKVKKAGMTRAGKVEGMSAGNLMMLPHRVALALQADGWVVRNDLIWQKVAPMPESVSGWRWERCKIKTKGRIASTQPKGQAPGQTAHSEALKSHAPELAAKHTPCPGCRKCADNDGYVLKRGSWRHTRAHEFIFMCTKKMNYWSNQEMVREAHSRDWHDETRGPKYMTPGDGRNDGGKPEGKGTTAGRNPRTVLTPKPSSYSGAHFATFPPGLIAPLIRASTPARCCPVCGSGWSPVVERTPIREIAKGDLLNRPKDYTKEGLRSKKTGLSASNSHNASTPQSPLVNILGHRPTCSCHASHDFHSLGQTSRDTEEDLLRCDRCGVASWTEPARQPCHEPGIVFDPFLGSGTTAMVAKELGLRWIGTDLSFEYLDLQAKVRAKAGTPSNWAEGLPMFEELT